MPFSYVLPSTPEVIDEVDILVSPLDRVVRTSAANNLGAGLLRPFRRDEKNDFANASGEAVVRACIGQILGTRCGSDTVQGELPWRSEFGSLLYALRHRRNDLATIEVAKVHVADALRRWEPRARVKDITVTRDVSSGTNENVLTIRVRYDIVAVNSSGNDVLVPDVLQTVTLSGGT